MVMKSKYQQRFRVALACGTAAIALLAPFAASAQDAAETQLEEVRVEQGDPNAAATSDTGVEPVKGVVAKSTRTGSKAATDLNEVPQSVTVVGREQLDDQGGQKIDEALRYVPGVTAATYGTDADKDWFFIRGFQADQSGIFLDGLGLYEFGFGTFLVDPFFLERVEVIKGPSSALYGGASLGGFVNYVSKRPTGERLRYVETGINNFGNGYFGFDIGDQVGSDAMSYRVNGKLSGGGWETDHAKDFKGTIAPSFTWKPDESTSLTILSSYQNVDLTHTSTAFLPYSGTVVASPVFGRIPRDFFFGEEDFDDYDRTQAMFGYEFEHTFDNGWTARQNLRYSHVSLQEQYLYGFGTDPLDAGRLNRFFFAHDTDVGIFAVDNQLEGTFSTGFAEHNLLVGLDYRNYNIDRTEAFAAAPSIDIRNPVYGGIPGSLFVYLDQELSRDQLGVYAQDQIKFGDGWIATLNGRYDFVSTEVENGVESDEGEFTWRAALAYEFTNGLTPYVSYSTSFNPTTDTDSDGNLLEPETGKQWEAGVKYQPTFFDGLITAAYFDITRQNVAGPTNTVPVRTESVGEIQARGFEASVQANVTEALKVISAFTYIDMEVTETTTSAPVGATPVQVPDLTTSLWLDYSLQNDALSGLSVAAGVRHVGKSWANAANTLRVPSATLLDAAIRYEKDNWAVALNVSNLFDKRYVASCTSETNCAYGSGRTFMLKASTSW